ARDATRSKVDVVDEGAVQRSEFLEADLLGLGLALGGDDDRGALGMQREAVPARSRVADAQLDRLVRAGDDERVAAQLEACRGALVGARRRRRLGRRGDELSAVDDGPLPAHPEARLLARRIDRT